MLRTFLISIAMAAVSMTAAAQTPADASAAAPEGFGPAVGDHAPDFSLPDASGAVRTLADLSGPNGVVIYFNRSLDWCPICLRQTMELEQALDRFQSAGWNVAVLTYDSTDILARVADQRDLTMALLSDEGSVVIDQFDVRDPIYAEPAHMAHGVPYPIAFAITPDGVVAGKFWHEAGLGDQRGYAVRTTADDVLQALGG